MYVNLLLLNEGNYHVMMQGGQLNPVTANPSNNWATAFPFHLPPPAGGWRVGGSLSAPPPKLPVHIENVAAETNGLAVLCCSDQGQPLSAS